MSEKRKKKKSGLTKGELQLFLCVYSSLSCKHTDLPIDYFKSVTLWFAGSAIFVLGHRGVLLSLIWIFQRISFFFVLKINFNSIGSHLALGVTSNYTDCYSIVELIGSGIKLINTHEPLINPDCKPVNNLISHVDFKIDTSFITCITFAFTPHTLCVMLFLFAVWQEIVIHETLSWEQQTDFLK